MGPLLEDDSRQQLVLALYCIDRAEKTKDLDDNQRMAAIVDRNFDDWRDTFEAQYDGCQQLFSGLERTSELKRGLSAGSF